MPDEISYSEHNPTEPNNNKSDKKVSEPWRRYGSHGLAARINQANESNFVS